MAVGKKQEQKKCASVHGPVLTSSTLGEKELLSANGNRTVPPGSKNFPSTDAQTDSVVRERTAATIYIHTLF